MGLPWANGYVDEIDRCAKLYPSFRDGADFLKSVSKALQKYAYENEGKLCRQWSVEDLPVSLDQVNDWYKKDQSLRLKPEIKAELLCSLTELISAKAVRANSSFKQVLKEIVGQGELLQKENELVTLDSVRMFYEKIEKETAIGRDMATFLFFVVSSFFYRQQLAPLIEVLRTDIYEGGDCPVCGEKPHYGMLRAEDGAKILECWLCSAQWNHTRVKCPFCSNDEREELGYFTVEDNELCRVNYCQSCCRYYKVFDTRKLFQDKVIFPAVHHLATLEYDALAEREGFFPGSELQWVVHCEKTD